jgi:hypothetical protein
LWYRLRLNNRRLITFTLFPIWLWFASTKLIGFVCRVARWYIFKPKILICVHFWGPQNGEGWYFTWPFGIYQGYLVFFGPNFWQFNIFFPFWYFVSSKIWQPCLLATPMYVQLPVKNFLFYFYKGQNYVGYIQYIFIYIFVNLPSQSTYIYMHRYVHNVHIFIIHTKLGT